MKKAIQFFLSRQAQKILSKYQPKIIGITGSIGKTSAKEAVYSVLCVKYKVRKNVKNYNNELGVPLTIIGSESGGRSFWRWLKVFSKAWSLVRFDKKYPKVLVLEMGADKIGDIGYLTKIAPCHIGVVTKVSPTHLEFFGSMEKIAKEKAKIISHLPADGTAILNADDPLVMKMKDKTRAKLLTFGLKKEADVTCAEINLLRENGQPKGLQFKINYRGSSVPMMIPGVVGKHQIYAALIAVSVGLAMGMNLVEVARGLRSYRSPKGRMRLLSGINDSLLIDDTYNSSPDAALAAVDSVAELATAEAGSSRKIAALGDMLELGEISDEAHAALGAAVARQGYDLLVTVGRFADRTATGAKEISPNLPVKIFADAEEAGKFLQTQIRQNDLILIKGSQGSRMEKVTRAIMKNPADAEKFLVRQTADWLKK